jgi:hypothetical protein
MNIELSTPNFQRYGTELQSCGEPQHSKLGGRVRKRKNMGGSLLREDATKAGLPAPLPREGDPYTFLRNEPTVLRRNLLRNPL